MLMTQDNVIICDPEDEYSPLVKRLGGQVIRLSPSSTDYVNPLDINLNYSEEENPLALNEPPQIVRTAQKTPPKQGYEILSNILAPKFHRCQFCFSLDTLVVVEIDIIVNQFSSILESLYLNSVYALRFEDREKIFS